MTKPADRIGRARATVPLVAIDAQILMEEFGRDAFWEARARQKADHDGLGRDRAHWKAVADVIVTAQGMFGETHPCRRGPPS